jgi:pimeloyl-ACP methyl ester carboxylesterase
VHRRWLEEPARARATVLVYRIWLTRELQKLAFATRRYAPLQMPVLFLQGEQDRALDPALLRGGERNVPNMTVETLPGVGHFVPEEAPDTVLARARDFFS